MHEGKILNRGDFVVSDFVRGAQAPPIDQDQRVIKLGPGESFKLSIDVAGEVKSLDLRGMYEVDLVLTYSIPFARSIENLDSGIFVDTIEIGRYVGSLSTQ